MEEANLLATQILGWEKTKPKIILVCNESSPQPKNQIEGDIIYLYNQHNKGYGGGNNIGLRKAYQLGYERSLLINPDAYIDEYNFEKLITTFINLPDAFAIGPILKEGNKDNWTTYLGGRNITEQINTRIPYDQSVMVKRPIKVDYVLGAIILLNLTLVNELDFLDEEYFFSGEIADLCYRARSIDHSSYSAPNTEGIHNIDHSEEKRKYLYLYYSMRNRFLFMKKHKYPFTKKLYWFSILCRQFFHAIITLNKRLSKTILLVIYHIIIHNYGNSNRSFKELIG